MAHTEHLLTNTDQIYRSIVDHSIAAIFLSSPVSGEIFLANPSASRIFGYALDEFIGQNRSMIFETDNALKNALEVRKSTGKFSGVVTAIRKNGERFPCEISSIIFTDIDGQLKASTTLIDISERKSAEEALQKSNERYELATKASFDAIWDADLTKGTIQWGEGFETLFGYKVEDNPVSGTTWDEHIHPDDREKVLKEHNRILYEESTQNFWSDEYRFIKSNGDISYVIDRGLILRDGSGKPFRVVGAMQDITELKIKEEQLVAINKRFHYASQATADIIWDWNLMANEIEWADNFTKVMGYPLPANSRLPLNFCMGKIHDDDRKKITDSLHTAINDPKEIKWENKFRYLRSDNSYAFVNDRGYIIRDNKGKAIRMIGAMQDVSKAKYHEDLLALELRAYEISSTPGIPFTEVVLNLLEGIEEMHPEMLTSVLYLNDDNTARHFPSPSIPESYLQQIDGLKIGPAVGSCGTAMFRKEPVIVADIKNDPLWTEFSKLAAEYNLHACWSLPIIHNNGKVLGSFAIYYNQIKSPSELEWNTVTKISNLFRILMENNEAMKQIKLTNERYNIISLATNDMVWDWDLNNGNIFRDPIGLKKVYGLNNNESINTTERWLARLHPDDKQKVSTVIADILSATDRKSFDIEYRYLCSDNTYSYVYDRGVIIHDQDGKPIRMIGAAQNITDRKLLEQELFLKELHKQKAISQAIIDTQEKERSHIGKELHDNVNQVLTTTKLYLDLATTDQGKLHEFISKCSDNIMYVINEIRKLSRSLMVPSLGDLGLLESLTDLTESINVTQKIHIECLADPSIENLLNETQKLILYRIIQEATNNIINHSEARSVLINLSTIDDTLQLIVSDDGIGFDKQNVRKGSGLNNIENRVYLFNGSLDINTYPGKGCELIILVPLHRISSEE